MAVSSSEPLFAPPDLSGSGAVRLSGASLAASPLNAVGYYLTLLYLVLLAGRVPEICAIFLGSSFYQILILTSVLLALILITGSVVRVGATKGGALWIGFHLWLVMTLPFSGYRRGSVESLVNVLLFLPATFFVGGFLMRNMNTLRKGAAAMAVAGAVGLTYLQYVGVSADEDRYTASGTFGNSNLLAIYLLFMIPFWAFFATRKNNFFILRLACVGLILMALSLVLKTGSRSGFLTICVLSLILFLSVSLASKAKFVVVAAMGIFLTVTTMPDTLKSRLGTIFHSERKDDVSAEAIGSSEARYSLLMNSLEATIKHPIVGSGFGVYSMVWASEKIAKGEKTSWQATHNMYTQISSELGIPGFILYMMALSWGIRTVWRVRKLSALHPELAEIGALCAALLCSWVVFCFNGFFASMALEFILYILLGFSIALSLVAEDILRDKWLAASGGVVALPPRSPRFFPAPVPVTAPAPVQVAAGSTMVPVLSSGPSSSPAPTPNADAPWRRNPRKYPPKPGTPGR